MGSAMMLVLLCIAGLAAAAQVQPNRCSDGSVNLARNVTVDVSECDNPTHCSLYKGKTYFLKTTFVPTVSVPDIKMRIYGLLGGLRIPHGPTRAICDSTMAIGGVSCQDSGGIQQGEKYVHVAKFPVKVFYPEINLKVRVVYFIDKTTLLCFEIPVAIKPSKRT